MDDERDAHTEDFLDQQYLTLQYGIHAIYKILDRKFS